MGLKPVLSGIISLLGWCSGVLQTRWSSVGVYYFSLGVYFRCSGVGGTRWHYRNTDAIFMHWLRLGRMIKYTLFSYFTVTGVFNLFTIYIFCDMSSDMG